VVRAYATDPRGSEAGPSSGTFLVVRSGSTDQDLTVYYGLAGTAENKIDYAGLPGSVLIPAKASFASVVVTPLNDTVAEGPETVELRLVEPPTANPLPTPYTIGSPAKALVTIVDDEPPANRLPKVTLVSPRSGRILDEPANVSLVAEATDPDGYVTKVEFYANDKKVGEAASTLTEVPKHHRAQVFSFDWKGVAAGEYVLTAKATDNQAASSTSTPITLSVIQPDLTPVVTVVAVDPFGTEDGPDTLTFRVRRTGPTTSALKVNIAMSGRATNGVDYLKVEDTVTIPAGTNAAWVVVTPINDTVREPAETVVMTLKPASAPVQPATIRAYVVRPPGRAVAIIADDDKPGRKVQAHAEGLHLRFEEHAAARVRIEASDDLRTWVPVFSGPVAGGAIDYVDADVPGMRHRFYRAMPEEATTFDND
jgi:hypothetical protein